MGISQRVAAIAIAAVLSGAVASCSAAGLTPGDQGTAGPAPVKHGPPVTLRVAVYGAPGYQQAGLFAAYERLHPGVRIVEDTAAQEPGYWQGLQRHLAAGRGSMTSSRFP
jgi:cellobiose transport system substrate-binding protein